MPIDRNDLDVLMQKFLAGNLHKEAEQDQLLRELELWRDTDDPMNRALTDAIWMHRLLEHYYDGEKTQFSIETLLKEAETPKTEALVEPDWTRLVDLAKESKPIERPPTEVKPKQRSAVSPTKKKAVYSKQAFRWYHAAPFVLVLTVILGGIWFEFLGEPAQKTTSETSFRPIGEISAAVGVVWPEGQTPLKSGQRLETGRFRFDEGMMELRLTNGIRIALEGPVDFRLNTLRQVFLDQGRLSCFVPPEGKGFEVTTPLMTLVDHGTEFSIDIDGEIIETHTLTGLTELTKTGKNNIELPQGNAVRIDTKGNREVFPADPKTFLTERRVEQSVAEQSSRELLAWKGAAEKWNADPGLLLRFDFEDMTKTVPNVARRSGVSQGRVSGAGRVEGRWKDKQAVDFRSERSSVGFELSRTFSSMTLIASVRLDSLERHSHCMLASTELGEGKLFWQFGGGAIRLAVQLPGGARTAEYDSPPRFNQRNYGAWYRIATVVDDGNKTVTHYIDGVPVSSLTIKESHPIRPGNVTLGNGLWKSRSRTNRSFGGRMDDFLLFDRALTAEEIATF